MKKFYSLLIALLCSATMAFAYEAQIDGVYYDFDHENKTATATYDGDYDDDNGAGYTQSEIVIPEKVSYNGNEYIVTKIGDYAFLGCTGFTSVTIPNSVTEIGLYAFLGCTGLTLIEIPNGVNKIDHGAFFGCTGLTSVVWNAVACNIDYPAQIFCFTEYVGERGESNEQIKSFTFGDSVKYIPAWLCSNIINLTLIEIPNSVTAIGPAAFYGCKGLTSVVIPSSVTTIGEYLFGHCEGLKSVTIPNNVTSVGNYAFYGCTGLISIVIPNSVTKIGYRAFFCCSSLTSITIPNSVTKIGNYVFYGCSSLTSITIPNSVTKIGNYVFYGCSSLTSITIPNSVTSIGEGAFSGCSSLTSITIPNSVTEIGIGAFLGTPWLENQSDGCVYINNYLYTYKGEMSANMHIDVKEVTTRICDYAFYGCSYLTSITIPNSVTKIGNYAFSGCSSLTSITIPNSVTSIGEGAFFGCSSLTSITIPNSVTEIGLGAFYGCTSLTSITIPNSVTSIGEYIFYGCSSLTSVTIPNSVTSIGNYAFSGCSSLTSITIQAENPPTIDEYTFENVPRSISIKVPCGGVSRYKAAKGWNEFTNYEEILSKLTVDVNDKTMGFATVTKSNSCADDVAQVQAQALAGYEFVRWSDGATENPHILLVTEDMTITAEFRKIGEEPEDKPGEEEKHNNFIVESADKTQGAVEITITAKAIEGFEFDHWSDGSTENPRVVILDEDVELYAYFRVAAGTGLENSVISSVSVYGNNGVLYVEGAETDYHVLDAAGRLVYSGRDVQLSLPRGVYVVNVGGEVQKVVI